MFENTQLLEPIGDPSKELVPFRDWDGHPLTNGLPSKNQLEWQKRQDPEFRRSECRQPGIRLLARDS